MRKLAGALSLLGALVPSIAQAGGLFADSAMPWTGVYVGAGIGRKWADTEWTTTCFGAACTTGGANPFLPDNSSPRDFATNGLRKTLYAGFNWQLEHWLLGVEGDVGYGSKVKFTPGIPGCTIFCGGLTPTPDDIDSASVATFRDASFRGRAGFLIAPNVLVYGTAGVAYQRVEANLTCSFAGPWCFPPTATDIRNETQSDTLRGWTAGGGLEWLICDHWLVRGEYRYADLGDFTPTFFSATQDAVFTDIHVTTRTGTVGIGYKF